MKAKLRSMYSSDVPDLEKYTPDDPENFGFPLDLYVGEDDVKGEERFTVMVCTPQWLTQTYSSDDIIIGRHYLIMFKYNYRNLLNSIHKYLQHCTGESWEEITQKVGRLGRWEFEDYRS